MRRRTYTSGELCSIHETQAGDKITHIRYPVDPASYPDKGIYATIKIKPFATGIRYIDVLLRAKGLSAFNIGIENRNLERLDHQPFSEMVPYTTFTYTNGTANTNATSGETMQMLSIIDENNNWNGAFQIKDGYFIIDLEKYTIAMVRRLALKWGCTFDSQTNTFNYSDRVYGVAFPTPAEIYNDCSNLGYGSGSRNNYDLWDVVEVYRV